MTTQLQMNAPLPPDVLKKDTPFFNSAFQNSKHSPPIVIFEGLPSSSKYKALHLVVGRKGVSPEGGAGSNVGSVQENANSLAFTHKSFTVSPKKPPYLSGATLLGIALIALFCLAVYAKRDFFPRLEGRVQSVKQGAV
jgi:hypothetical protein